MPSLILGSTSRYRRELLARLRLPFDVQAPQVDEMRRPGEPPAAMAQRLALAKAREVATRHPGAVVIGSDQVAELDGEPIGKPGSHERATAQLTAMSGRSVVFHTAVAVVRPSAGFEGAALVPVTVRFRVLEPMRSSATCASSNPTTVRAARRSKRSGSRCWSRCTPTTRRRSSDFRSSQPARCCAGRASIR